MSDNGLRHQKNLFLQKALRFLAALPLLTFLLLLPPKRYQFLLFLLLLNLLLRLDGLIARDNASKYLKSLDLFSHNDGVDNDIFP